MRVSPLFVVALLACSSILAASNEILVTKATNKALNAAIALAASLHAPEVSPFHITGTAHRAAPP